MKIKKNLSDEEMFKGYVEKESRSSERIIITC